MSATNRTKHRVLPRGSRAHQQLLRDEAQAASSEQHDVHIYAQAGPVVHGVGTAAHWARCSCGWSHRGSFHTREEAQALADEHTGLMEVAATR